MKYKVGWVLPGEVGWVLLTYSHRYIYWMEDCIYQLMLEHEGSILLPNLVRW
jgi:hypothetical protein